MFNFANLMNECAKEHLRICSFLIMQVETDAHKVLTFKASGFSFQILYLQHSSLIFFQSANKKLLLETKYDEKNRT
jgi:hypothetical protein